MADDIAITTGIARHGASRLPSVDVDSFNLELKDEDGFLGDRASKGAFRAIFDKWRKPLRKSGEDPFGDEPSEKISKKALDAILVGEDVAERALAGAVAEEAVLVLHLDVETVDVHRGQPRGAVGGDTRRLDQFVCCHGKP